MAKKVIHSILRSYLLNAVSTIGVTLTTWMLATPDAKAQTCQYLAYDGFPYSDSTVLHGAYGGTGWDAPWDVQNGNTALPGYMALGQPSMGFGALLTAGSQVVGGRAYLSAGRKLNLNTNGPFAMYRKSNGKLGLAGTTIYMSALIRKDVGNDDPVHVMLQGGNNVAWVPNSNPRIQLGYFGASSNQNGNRYWGIALDGVTHRSNQPIVLGQAALMVVKIEFGVSGGTVSAWVNPAQIAGNEPTPDLVVNATNVMEYVAVATTLGNSPMQGALDEIRIASSYACVTPDTLIAVNTPPFAAFTPSPPNGTIPLAVSFDGSASSDVDGPLVPPFYWDFGDGIRDTTSTLATAHTYNFLGIFTPTLRVQDSGGLTHTAYGRITVSNVQGTYPCYSYLEALSRPSCASPYGSFRVQGINNPTLALTNSAGQPMLTSNGTTTFDSLLSGPYTLLVSDAGGCRDTFELQISADSSWCPGWNPPACLNLGINLDGTSYYDRQRIFKNFFSTASQWITFNASGPSPWDTQMASEMPVDSAGYPLEVPFISSIGPQKARVMISAIGHMLPGDYVVLYDGTGTLQVLSVNTTLSAPGRIEFTIPANYTNNIWMDLSASQSADPIRNIRILRVQHESNYAEAPYYEAFMQKLQPFSTIRFMDVMATNSDFPPLDWNDRKQKYFYTQSTGVGMSYEHIVGIANEAQKNIWINIPHTASESYMREMAKFFRDSLACGLEIYVEYSNEVWNWMFPQAHEVAQNEPQNIAYPRRYAERCRKAFRIWTEEFAGQESRLHRVLNTQSAYPTYGMHLLAHLEPSEYDYLSPAWYFSYNGSACSAGFDSTTTPAQIIQCSRNHWLGTLATQRKDYLNAALFGKKIVNYEGGQHMTDFGMMSYTPAVWAAQTHPDIYNLYNQVIDTLKRLGTDLAIAYNLARINETIWGSFGHLDDIDISPDSSNAPKWMALLHNTCPYIPPQPLDTTVSVLGGSLAATPGMDGYQWYDCASGLPLQGETQQTFTPSASGSYQVQINRGACIGWSGCMVVTRNTNPDEPTLIVYPNPAQHSLNCIFPWEGRATLSNLQGQTCWEGSVGRSETLDIQSLPNGVYFLGFEGLNVKILIHR